MAENNDVLEILTKLGRPSVLCVGDVMLDRFVDGSVSRISPEAPTPVLRAGHESTMPGGAGNTAACLAALGVSAHFIGVVGADAAADELRAHFSRLGVTAELVVVPSRVTTEKTRYVCGAQHLLRVDREVEAVIVDPAEKQVIALAEKLIPACDAVILSDYNKGVLTGAVIAAVMAAAKAAGKPVVVDPKGRDFARYRGASFLTPNEKELSGATGMPVSTAGEVEAACRKLVEECGVDGILATRGAAGLSVVTVKAAAHVAASAEFVRDVAGAGDAALAAFAAALGVGVDAAAAARFAEAAAGRAVTHAGTATVTREEIRAALSGKPVEDGIIRSTLRDRIPAAVKLMTREEAGEQAKRWRAQGLKVGFTNGTFDLIHPGHLASIRATKAHCDRLVVAINSDASVKRYKGPTRPVQDEAMRATIMSAIGMVDAVVIFEEDTPLETLQVIRPDILVKGGEYKLETLVGYDLLMSYGGRVILADMQDGFSTTSTIKKMGT